MAHASWPCILEIQDTIPTCLGYLSLKLGIVKTIYGRIYNSIGKGSVIMWAAMNLGSNQVNCSNLRPTQKITWNINHHSLNTHAPGQQNVLHFN
jgi:hypothetical protein